MEKTISNIQPCIVCKYRHLGQPIYVINFDIEEVIIDEVTQYTYYTAELPPAVWKYDVIVDKIVSTYYPTDKVQAVINNCLQNLFNEDALQEYIKLQQCRDFAKKTANELMRYASEHDIIEPIEGEEPDVPHDDPIDEKFNPDGLNMLVQALTLIKAQASDLPDEQAKDVPTLFPTWASKIGETLNVGERLYYDNKLFKVIQSHTAQLDWSPNVALSLFAEISADPEQGTKDNPIPYNGNMELEQGKYYSQDGVTYLCTRSTGIPVYNALRDLVGLYVQVAS